MRFCTLFRILLCSLFLNVAATANAKDTIDVYPRIGSTAPATVKVTTRIEPNAANRQACVGYDGPAQARESCWQLDGDKERRTVEHWFRDLPGGWYVAYVGVWKVGQKTPEVSKMSFCVVSSVSDPDQTGCSTSD